jgi:hypothetical protein
MPLYKSYCPFSIYQSRARRWRNVSQYHTLDDEDHMLDDGEIFLSYHMLDDEEIFLSYHALDDGEISLSYHALDDG